MSFKINFTIFIFFCHFFTSEFGFSQDQRFVVEIPENNIKLNESFILSIIAKNTENKPICKFPELAGFKKRAVSSTIITNNLNGKSVIDQKVSQEYFPNKVGQFNFANIVIIVNEFAVNSNSFSITVAESEKDEVETNFKDFIDGSAYELVDVKDDAFFAVTSNKLRPYVGEGFLITVAFYIAKNNKAEMEFFNENSQLDEILRKLRPKNCWEESIKISEIIAKPINIANKMYFQYKISQAIYYPFNNQPISIPKLAWQMRKYKVAKDRELSDSKMEDYKTYFSKPIFIKPINLPKNNNFVTDFVGDFELEERIDKEKVQTGRSFNYKFIVRGIGNLSVIKFPESLSDSLFEIYEPKESQQISTNLGKPIPEKTFSFDIVPKFAGRFSLKNHFAISYFNVKTKSYQTLRAEKDIEVVGINIKNETEPIANTGNDLYTNIDQLKSDETSFDFRTLILKTSNILVIAMLVAMIYIVWPSSKK
jgi:BatD DUF11 like domain